MDIAAVTLSFTVYGPPAAQGSKTVARSKAGRSFVRESSNRVKPFRESVASAAVAAGASLIEGSVILMVRVIAVRPDSHYTASHALRKGTPDRPGGHDASKVLRAVEDALAGICYRNDRQVRVEAIEFNYGAIASVAIVVGPVPVCFCFGV